MKLYEFCVNAIVFFQYDYKLCKQITGMPMGYPVSVVVTKILNYNTNYVLLQKICVDDCLAVVKTSEIDNLLAYINSINKNIQFTVEKELDNTLPFLDSNICKQNDGS